MIWGSTLGPGRRGEASGSGSAGLQRNMDALGHVPGHASQEATAGN